jgi:succinoglycan biosynthesis transport protein ExoP
LVDRIHMTSLVPYTKSSDLAVAHPPPGAPPEQDGLDFASLFEAARRRYAVFLSVFVIVMALAVVLTFHQKPSYTATSTVMMDPRQLQLVQPARTTAASEDLPLNTEAVTTQVQLLQSRSLAEQVVNQLHLDQDPTLTRPKRGMLGRTMEALTKLISPNATKVAPTQQEIHDAVVDQVMASLTPERLGLTYVIAINYVDTKPERAAAAANTFANTYVQQSLQFKSDASRQAGGYINDRLRELSNQAASDAAAVQQYKVTHNLLGNPGATLTQQQIANLNQEIATAGAEAAADQARVTTARDQLRGGSNGEDVGAVLSSPVIQSLRSQRAQISGQLAELGSRYGPRHPDVLKAKQQLADIDTQIREETHRAISNLQATAQVSAGRLASLQNTLNDSRGTLAQDTRAEAGLTELTQKATASQTLYDDYLARFKEIMASSGTEQSDARIVSVAQLPRTPTSPRIVLDLALGIIVASLFGVIAGVVAELVDRSFASGVEIERRLQAHYLGSVPLLASVARGAGRSPSEYVATNPFSVFAESFRNLKVSIVQARDFTGPVVVAVTSPLTGEGKTTTSVCLGETSSLQGAKTIVVDCDLRRRTLQRFLKSSPEVGLVEVIQGEATLDEAIVVDELTNLHFLPLSQAKLSASDVFGGQAMDVLLNELRRRYDFVILDSAPLLALADARTLAAKSDAVILLCRWRKTPQDALKSGLRLLQAAGAPLIGVTLTRVDVRKQSAHGYGDSTYYYRETREYYAS